MYYYLLYINKEDILKRDTVEDEEMVLTNENGEKNKEDISSPVNSPAPAMKSSLKALSTKFDNVNVKLTKSDNVITYTDLNFLHKVYEPQYWYWEIVETIRRLFFTAFLVLANTSANLQIVGSIVMSVVFMKLYGFYAPYEDDSDDMLQEMAQYQVFFTLFA